MIGLSFLPVSQTFVFTMGDSIISLEGEPRSFPSRKLACEAANRKGLKVSKGNVVSVEKVNAPSPEPSDPTDLNREQYTGISQATANILPMSWRRN